MNDTFFFETYSQVKLSPEQFAEIIGKEKPYLIAIEERVRNLSYGTIDCKLEVRAGAVEKVQFFESKNWLKPKLTDQQKSSIL